MNVKTRQMLEKKIAAKTIALLLAAGFAISVNDGEETTLDRSVDKKQILNAMFSTDEDYLYVHLQYLDLTEKKETHLKNVFGWIYFVYGNSGFDVVTDYTVNLETQMSEIQTLSNTLEEQFG